MFERIFHTKEIRDVESATGIHAEDEKRMRREIAFKAPFIIARTFVGALADRYQPIEWLGPEARPTNLESHGPLAIHFDPDKFRVALRQTMEARGMIEPVRESSVIAEQNLG